jgi:hypothetical protein
MAAYAAQRTQFGKQLISFGQIQRLLADSYAAMSAGRFGPASTRAAQASGRWLHNATLALLSGPTQEQSAREAKVRPRVLLTPAPHENENAGRCCMRRPRESRSTSRLRRGATRACRPTQRSCSAARWARTARTPRCRSSGHARWAANKDGARSGADRRGGRRFSGGTGTWASIRRARPCKP